MHEEFTLAAVDDVAHRVFPRQSERLDARLAQLRARPYTIFAKLLMPALSRAVTKAARMQVHLDCARIACAIERHHLATGALPDQLTALVPRLLDRVPTDVIDGNPLRYARKPDGSYMIYSIGWNESDDGGEIALTKGTEPASDLMRGDWVWRMPATLSK
jgi:hypothetical protein